MFGRRGALKKKKGEGRRGSHLLRKGRLHVYVKKASSGRKKKEKIERKDISPK